MLHGSKQVCKRVIVIKKLWQKYNEQNQNNTVSYSVFAKLRPFWVVAPSLQDRNTCACLTCSNMILIHEETKKVLT